ncbi:MAG: hypothetical protein JSV04_13275 [Candidatus Heimdallarchaeota archaeon]|nr:MAG: hypothetical protein JSV04_13275 [Candidatus Heimdallarchaeota archaeon]
MQRQKNTHRGQLQIAETLISVALMLVLALLLINAASQTRTPYANLMSLDQTATDILLAADETGLLRPVVYLHGNGKYYAEFSTYQDQLDDFISSILPNNIDYTLIAHEVHNGTPDQIYFTLLGSSGHIASLQQGGEGIVANYHLGSFSSSTFGQFHSQYLVQLYLWEKFS